MQKFKRQTTAFWEWPTTASEQTWWQLGKSHLGNPILVTIIKLKSIRTSSKMGIFTHHLGDRRAIEIINRGILEDGDIDLRLPVACVFPFATGDSHALQCS